MGTYRLFSGSDGQSHIEAIDLAKTPDWTNAQDTTNIKFSEAAAGRSSDWHTAPRRQYVIILSGQLEIGLGDGSKQVFGPGDARLVDVEVEEAEVARAPGVGVDVDRVVYAIAIVVV